MSRQVPPATLADVPRLSLVFVAHLRGGSWALALGPAVEGGTVNLHDAARAGDLTALHAQISAREPIEARDSEGRTPLMVAAEAGRGNALRALIQAGAQLDAAAAPGDRGSNAPADEPAAVGVIRYGLFDWIAPIVRGEAAVTARRKTELGPTALMIAAAAGHAEATEILLRAGADAGIQDRDGFTALAYAAALGHATIVASLIQAGAEVDPIDHFRKRPIVLAALTGQAEAARVLAAAGAALAEGDSSSLGPLHSAAYHGHAEVVQVLLEAGADPNARAMNRAPLDWAITEGHTEIVRLLANGSADLDAPDWRGLTPLVQAVAKRNGSALRAMLEAGAKPNAQVKEPAPGLFSSQALPGGATVLHLAACLGDPEMVSALLAAGADPQARDGRGFTPLLLASASGHAEAARLLRAAAPPTQDDAHAVRDSELVGAVRRGDAARVRALLDLGASGSGLVPDTFKYHYLLRAQASDDFFDPSIAKGEGSFSDANRPVLCLALEIGDDEIIAALLAAGASVEAADRGSSASAPLVDAARQGRRAAVSALIAAGFDVNAKNAEGCTPLMAAAEAGHAEIVRALVAAGAKVNVRHRKETPLTAAASKGHVDILQILLAARAKVQPGDLACAALTGGVEAARLVLEAGRAQKVEPRSSPWWQAIYGRSEPMVKFLLDAGFDPNDRGETGKPALVDACRVSPEMVRLLVEAGADVNAREPGGASAVSVAVAYAQAKAVRLLVERGADTESRMDGAVKGETPLIHAAGYGIATLAGKITDPAKTAEIQRFDDETILLLLEHGADVAARDHDQGRTPLMHAAAQGREPAVRMLLAAGAEVDARDERSGRTALMLAAMGGYDGIVRLLLEAGASARVEDLDGNTAAALARQEGKASAQLLLKDRAARRPRSRGSPVQVLKKAAETGDAEAVRSAARAGANVNTQLSGGRTPLMVATEKGHTFAIKALLDAGADPNRADSEGQTPLIAAIAARRVDIVCLLLGAGADPDGKGREIAGCGRETPLSAAIGDRSLAMTNAWQDVVNGLRDEYALGTEHVEMVRALIAAGASVDAEDELGMRPLWYASDTAQPELAELLAEAGAGREPVGASYLRAGAFPGLAQGDPFRDSARLLAELCGAAPEPLTGRPTHREFLALRRGGPFPSGPTIGAAFTVPRAQAGTLIAEHQKDLLRQGAFLYRAQSYVGNFDVTRQQLGLLPTGDKYDVIAAICGPGTDWGWTSPGLYMRDLRIIEADYPFTLIGCERRSFELEFAKPIADAAELARRLTALRTSLDAPGLPENADVKDLVKCLRRQSKIHFHWE